MKRQIYNITIGKIKGLRLRLWPVRSYKYAEHVRRSPAIWLTSIVVIFGAGFWVLNVYLPTQADSDIQTIRPDGDFGTTNNFAANSGASDSSCASGTHCDYVDEADDAEWLGTGTGMDTTTAEEEFDFGDITVSGTLNQITQVQATVRAGINGSCQGGGTNCDSINVRLFIDGAYDGTTNSVTLTTSPANHTFTWSSLTEPTASDIRIEVVRVANGTGPGAGRDDDVRIYEVKADVTFDYTPPATTDPPLLSLGGYTFENDDGFTVTSANSGGRLPGTGTGASWTNPVNITADDDVRATTTLGGGSISGVLEGSNYGFTIPSGATITGIVMTIQKCQSGSSGNIRDAGIRLLKSGSPVGDNKADTGTNWTTFCTLGATSYGSSTDTWGVSWTPSDINASNFGANLTSQNSNPTFDRTAEVDHITITVHYEITAGDPDAPSVQAGSEFTTSKTLSQVRKGEPAIIRAHLTNNGGQLMTDTELALFYDNGDGVWTKVQNQMPAETASGSGCNDSDWTCLSIDTSGDVGEDTSIVFDNRGIPWMSYEDDTNSDLKVARFVGSGGNGCAVDSWSCTTVDSDGTTGIYAKMALDENGNPWVSYRRAVSNVVKIAHYVGSGGSGCADSAWTCTTVDDTGTSGTGRFSSIAFDQAGNPWIAYAVGAATNSDLRVAEYVGSGGSGCGTTTEWDCTDVDTTDNVGADNSLAFDAGGTAWVAYRDTTNSNLNVARFVGSGGNCDTIGAGSDAWECTVVAPSSGDVAARSTSLAFNPAGNAWISYYLTSSGDLKLAQYVGGGSGTGCTSSDWTCTDVDTSGDIGSYNSMAFDPGGNAWISYYDATNSSMKIARYVGSGGSSCATGSWQCTSVDVTNDVGTRNSISFDYSGRAFVSYRDAGTNLDLRLAYLEAKTGEILQVPSIFSENGDTLNESHADMMSSADTTNRNDTDCLSVGASWNNGRFFEAENGSGLSIPDGQSTAQCTEVAWTIDTSQAVPGTTYRFVIATNDSFRPDKNPWRGPVAVATDGYPTLTIASEEAGVYRYSKDVLGAFGSNCSGDSTWSCSSLDSTDVVGSFTSTAFDSTGTPWVSYYDTTGGNLEVAKYVGSGGNCDTAGAGSDAWQCTTVDATDNVGQHASLAFDLSGNPWISYLDSTSNNLEVAHYVGSGGNCDASGGSDAWQCTTVDATDSVGHYSSISFDQAGTAWISYHDHTVGELKVTHYVGSGGNCDTVGAGSDAWQCTLVFTTNQVGSGISMSFDSNGSPWISFYDATALDLGVAKYVGQGGNCDDVVAGSDAWQCTIIDATDDVGHDSSIAFDDTGNPWITYRDLTNGNLEAVEYVGSGGNCDTVGAGSDAWQCTTIDATDTIGQHSSLAFDPAGMAWVSYYDNGTNDNLEVAHYVGSGGNCDTVGAGSDAWQCTTVDTTDDVGNYSSLAFDHAGNPWVSYQDTTNGNLEIARMKLPPSYLSAEFSNMPNGRNAGSGDLRYHLSAGLAPYTNPYGTCSSPTGDNNGYCGLFHPDGQSDSVIAAANERPIYGFSTRFSSNSTLPTATLHFQTSVSPSTNNVVLQVYRYGTTNAWETVSTYSAAGCASDNCIIMAIPSGTASEYFETDGSNYWVHYRVYQVESSSTAITFALDSFTAEVPQKQLRGGRVFRELTSDPLGW